MNTDIRIPVDFFTHYKTVMLADALGWEAVCCLMRSWVYLAQRRPEDGSFAGMTNRKIAMACGWKQDPDAFVDTLVDAGFLDGEPNAYMAHDWAEHQPYCVGAPDRSEKARKAAHARHAKSKGGEATSRPTATASKPQEDPSKLNPATSMQPASSERAPDPDPDPVPDPSPAPAPHARDAAVLEPGFRPASDDDDALTALAAGGPHGAMLPEFKTLVEAFADLAGVAPMLSPHRLGELRSLCVAVQLMPVEVVTHMRGWRDDLLARGKPVPTITSPNFFLGIVQERQANGPRAAPTTRENVNVPVTTATYLE